MRRGFPADGGVGVIRERFHIGAAGMKRLVAFGCEIDSGVGGFPEAYARAGAVAVIDLEIEYDAAVGIIGIRFADRVFSSLVPEDCAALELLDLSVHFKKEFAAGQDFDTFKRWRNRCRRDPFDIGAGEKSDPQKLYFALFHNKRQKKILSVNCFHFDV